MAVVKRNVHKLSFSAADDAAFRALADISRITAELDDVRVVGGQMVSLLTAAFPAPDLVERRTVDADAAMSTAIAASGDVHTALLASGYEPTAGNSYAAGDRHIDLLVPSPDGRFGEQRCGERVFDGVPGLHLAVSVPPLHVDLDVTLRDGTGMSIEVRVPTVECAVIIKALATRTRTAAKDYADLDTLLRIADAHDVDDIGGWKLDGEAARTGARGDAARQLTELARGARRTPGFVQAGVQIPRFQALVRRHVLELGSARA